LVAGEVAEDMQLNLAVVGFTGLEPTPHVDRLHVVCRLEQPGRGGRGSSGRLAEGCLRGDGLLKEPPL